LNDVLSAEPKQNGGQYVLSEEDDTVAQWKRAPEIFRPCWLFFVWSVKSVSSASEGYKISETKAI